VTKSNNPTIVTSEKNYTSAVSSGVMKGAKLTDFKGVYSKNTDIGTTFIVRFKVKKETTTKIVGYEKMGMTAKSAFILKLEMIKIAKIMSLEEDLKQFQFVGLFEQFLIFKKPIMAKNTYRNYKSHFSAYLKKYFSDSDVRTVDAFQMQNLINILLETKKPATVEKIKDTLKVFYRWLQDTGLVTINPARQLVLPKYDNTKNFLLPGYKVKAIYQYTTTIKNPIEQQIVGNKGIY